MAELGIFRTFRGKSELTGEARRQRGIIAALAGGAAARERTRTAIAQKISGDAPWKNVYSGVFKDFEDVLVPLGLAREEGRLPIKRGPKSLQKEGMPYYQLTEAGTVAALSFDSDARGAAARRFFAEPGPELAGLAVLNRMAPGLVTLVFERYVRRYCGGRLDALVPVTAQKLRESQEGALDEYRGMLAGFDRMPKAGKAAVLSVLAALSGEAQHPRSAPATESGEPRGR